MITVVVGKEIEKIKGDFESYLNGLNMVGEISYSQYSKLYDEGTKQIQRAYELGKTDLEKENSELKEKLKPENCLKLLAKEGYIKFTSEQLTKATEIIKKLYAVYYDPCVTESDLKYRDELFTEIKQFLSEVGK